MNKFLLSILLLVSSVASGQVDFSTTPSGDITARVKGKETKKIIVDYEKNNSGTLSGATTTPTVLVKAVRLGDMVTITIPAIALVIKNASVGGLVVSNLVPDGFRPTREIRFISYSTVNNVSSDSLFIVQTNGTFIMYNDIDIGTNIAANTTNCGWTFDITLSYILD